MCVSVCVCSSCNWPSTPLPWPQGCLWDVCLGCLGLPHGLAPGPSRCLLWLRVPPGGSRATCGSCLPFLTSLGSHLAKVPGMLPATLGNKQTHSNSRGQGLETPLMSAQILEQLVEMEALLQHLSAKGPKLNSEDRPWHSSADLLLLQVTQSHTLRPRGWSPVMCDPSPLAKGTPCTTAQLCLQELTPLSLYFPGILRTPGSSQGSCYTLSSSSGNY